MKGPDRLQLMRTALGQEYADLAIINADVLNVYTGEVLSDCSILVKGEWIASIEKGVRDSYAAQTKVIDASRKVIVPGLIDAHTHIFGQFYHPGEFLKYVLAGGTTTIITEIIEPFLVTDKQGLKDLLQSIKSQPIKIFGLLSPKISISDNVAPLSLSLWQEFIEDEDILGLGESYWQGVVQRPETFLPLMEKTLQLNKILEGHSAGARGKKLNAYATAGISSCHEPIDAEEAIERLRLGIYVMIREGSIRKDLDKFISLKQAGVDLRRLILVTDSVDPEEMVKTGYMEHVVQKAIDVGFDPIEAFQMASLNPAEHFGLDHLLGGIAPGRQADMLILPDLREVRPEQVISKGRVIATKGTILVTPRIHSFEQHFFNTIHLSKNFEVLDFSVQVKEKKDYVKVRIIEQVTDLITKQGEVEMPVLEGKIFADTSKDILKVAAIDRKIAPGKTYVSFVRGFQLNSGAMASSAAWDSTDIIVVGADEEDMALAVNRIRELQGGIVICSQGKISAELPLPAFGMISLSSLEEMVEDLKQIKRAAEELGCLFPRPWLSLNILTCAAIPFFRICEQGLVDFKTDRTLDVFLSP